MVGELKEGDTSEQELKTAEELAVEFWEFVTNVVKPWKAIADGTLDPSEAREDHISSYPLILWAVAQLGGLLIG